MGAEAGRSAVIAFQESRPGLGQAEEPEGVARRRSVEDDMIEVARCRRTGTSLAVMVCDLDNFKQINDLYGHLEGDNLLKDFAAHLKETCRGYDYVARMGGDEFVIVAPGLQQEAGIEKASRLNQLAIEASRKIAGRNLVALSVGTAFCPQDGFDVERLLAEADRRMYSMKQVHHAEPSHEAELPPSRARGATVN